MWCDNFKQKPLANFFKKSLILSTKLLITSIFIVMCNFKQKPLVSFVLKKLDTKNIVTDNLIFNLITLMVWSISFKISSLYTFFYKNVKKYKMKDGYRYIWWQIYCAIFFKISQTSELLNHFIFISFQDMEQNCLYLSILYFLNKFLFKTVVSFPAALFWIVRFLYLFDLLKLDRLTLKHQLLITDI